MKTSKPETVSEYLSAFPKDTQKILKQVRSTIKKALPGAKEKISYGIPTFTMNDKYVIYFAGFKKHVSVYPAPRGKDDFKDILSKYKGGKGTVQFPLDKPVPLSLITKIAKYRLKEHRMKEAAR